jgi:hypothetical protein
MSAPPSCRRARTAWLLSRLVWPTTILFAVTLLVVFTMILWTGDSANRTAAERERVQLAAAIEQTLDGLRGSLAQLVSRLDREGLGSPPRVQRPLGPPAPRRPSSTAPLWLRQRGGSWPARRATTPRIGGLRPDAADRRRRGRGGRVNLAGAGHQVGTAGEAFPFDLSLARLVAGGDATFAVAAVPLLTTGLDADEPASPSPFGGSAPTT